MHIVNIEDFIYKGFQISTFYHMDFQGNRLGTFEVRVRKGNWLNNDLEQWPLPIFTSDWARNESQAVAIGEAFIDGILYSEKIKAA